MRRIVSLTFLAATVFVWVPRSMAQSAGTIVTPRPATHGTGIGVGVTGMLLGPSPSGLSVAYDAGPWHADSMLGIFKPGTGIRPNFELGARFWYHLHNTTNSDFSVGGGLGFSHVGNTGHAPDNAQNGVFIELGAQIRAFLTANVALSATMGMSIATGDFDSYGLGGQALSDGTLGGFASVGLHYYFY